MQPLLLRCDVIRQGREDISLVQGGSEEGRRHVARISCAVRAIFNCVLLGSCDYVPLDVFYRLIIDADGRANHWAADHSLVGSLGAIHAAVLVDADLEAIVHLQIHIVVPTARLLHRLLLCRRRESNLLLYLFLVRDLDQLAMELGNTGHRRARSAEDSRGTCFAQLLLLHAN